MRFSVITIFPEMFQDFLGASLIGKAVEKGAIDVRLHDLRDYTEDRHRTVDDEPYGGGGGMVMKAEPWIRAVRAVAGERAAWRVLLSPQGTALDDGKVRELSSHQELVLLCGRYEGVDERVRRTVVDEEISIGDYVLSGGELPAMVLIEAMARQVPGVVGLPDSVEEDSFRQGLLDYPHFTRPREVEGLEVPKVLLSGNHEAISLWRRKKALQATFSKRPDLLRRAQLDEEQRAWLAQLEAGEPTGDS